LTFFTRLSPDNLKTSFRTLADKTSRNKRGVLVTAAAVVAVGAVVTPVVVQNAYAEPAKKTAAVVSEVVKGSPIAPLTVQHKAAQASFNALAVAQITEEQVKGRASLTELDTAIRNLQTNYSPDSTKLDKLTDAADKAVVDANKAAKAHDAAVVAAAKAAAEAAAKAAAEARAREAAAAAALANVNTPSGAQATAQSMMASRYGWGSDQFQCLVSLWDRESGWNYQSYNAGSGATGIPQALPGSKMASAGSDWATNAATQISWGLGYIAGSYGTPCAAWGHSESSGWY
jgi:septal ring factor EnvC (AmiA/AmiB activator)